jgi:hypothetical protein
MNAAAISALIEIPSLSRTHRLDERAFELTRCGEGRCSVGFSRALLAV